MSPKGESGVGTGDSDVANGMMDEQAREAARKASAIMKEGLFFTTLG
jgi:hypothetical protein